MVGALPAAPCAAWAGPIPARGPYDMTMPATHSSDAHHRTPPHPVTFEFVRDHPMVRNYIRMADASLEQIQYHLYVVQKIEAGLRDVEEGRLLSQQEVERRIAKWPER